MATSSNSYNATKDKIRQRMKQQRLNSSKVTLVEASRPSVNTSGPSVETSRLSVETSRQRDVSQASSGTTPEETRSQQDSGQVQDKTAWLQTLWNTTSSLMFMTHGLFPYLCSRTVLYVIIIFCLVPLGVVFMRETACTSLLSDSPSFSITSFLLFVASYTLCKRTPRTHINVSPEISRAPSLPRYGESLPQLAAWAAYGTDFPPLTVSETAPIASFESSLRKAFNSLAGVQRNAKNLLQDIHTRPAGSVRWWSISNTPAATARERVLRLIVVLEGGLRSLETLESSLAANVLEQTFKPMSATCEWDRKLRKQEQALRGELVYIGDDTEREVTLHEALESVTPHSASARIACRVTEISTEQLRTLRGRLQRGAVPKMVELGRSAQLLAAEGRAKGRWATEADVARWEEEVVQLAVDFDKVVAEAWKGWDGEFRGSL